MTGVVDTPPVLARRGGGLAALVAAVVDLLTRLEPLVLLVARLVVAHAFWASGQTKVSGPVVPLALGGIDLSFTIPTAIKDSTYFLFESEYSGVPLPPVFAAVAATIAEHVLPVVLVIGLAARFAALGLLVMTAVIQIFVYPDAWWTVHAYWAALTLVIMARGPGAISFDHLIARSYRPGRV